MATLNTTIDRLTRALETATASLQVQAATYRHKAETSNRKANIGLAVELESIVAYCREQLDRAKAEGH